MSLQRTNQNTVLYVHVRRTLVEAGAPIQAILEDVNRIVRNRTAIVLANGQFLRKQISSDWNIERYFDNETSTPYDHPARTWDEAQQDYFMALWGIQKPYQYAEEPDSYDQFCIGAVVPEPYLVDNEKILALVDAERDEKLLYCPIPCGGFEIVYTSRHRLICMKCGHLHCVLTRPLAGQFKVRLNTDEWYQLFDSDGELIASCVTLPTVDYRAVSAVEPIWTTDAWLEATREVEIYATGTPEEIEVYESGLVNAEAFLEAGFIQVPTVPPPSVQMKENGFGFDIIENARAAINRGASAYVQSRNDPGELRAAVLNLFQAVELTLKIRLFQFDRTALRRPISNPAVLEKLRAENVILGDNDIAAIGNLRRLRNQLQHGEASYSYRTTRTLLRLILVFLDDFSLNQLGWWMGDAVPSKPWCEILRLEEIQRNAEDVAASRIAVLDTQVDHVAQGCPNCGRQTLVRARLGGSECMYCRHRLTLKDVRFVRPTSMTSSVE